MIKKQKVAVIMGSRSDLKVMREATVALKKLKVPYEVMVVSAHRTPEYMFEYAKNARQRGVAAIIAGAGGAAHLPGMVASLTSLPVIGVPILVGKMNGLDALLSIAQMPKGVPVACVAVNNAFNAGLLACRVLAVADTKLASRLDKFKNDNRRKVFNSRKIK